MLSSDKLNKLFALASGKKPEVATTQAIKKGRPAADINKKLNYYRSAYEDPTKAWSSWVTDSKKHLTADNAEDVWNHAETNYPGDPSQARDAIRSNIRSGISSEPVSREVDLRNTIQSAPAWMQPELAPEMAITSNVVSSQNSAKAKSMYSMALQKKMDAMDLGQLDIDVPTEVHTQEFIALELLNKLDEAKIVQGRLCILNQKGEIQPVYSLMDTPEVQNMLSSDNPESEMVSEIASQVVVPRITAAMDQNKELGSMDNRASGGAALGMLKSGDVPVDNWGSLLGMINGNGVSAGIQGLASRNPHISQEDEYMQSMDIADRYGELNG
jgi:hypothetical protein